MQHLRVALYARVSSGHQVSDATIASQIAALDARLAQDGVRAGPEHRFVDDGHSGDTLLRPALERLRMRLLPAKWIASMSIPQTACPGAMPTRLF